MNQHSATVTRDALLLYVPICVNCLGSINSNWMNTNTPDATFSLVRTCRCGTVERLTIEDIKCGSCHKSHDSMSVIWSGGTEKTVFRERCLN